MEFYEEFRERGRVDRLLGQIRREASGEYTFMEVCGGHTNAIHGYGIPGLLPENINLISGPGCPVCVTSRTFIDHAIALSSMPGIIIATFGDLLRVPGTFTTLEKEKAAGKYISVVYSVNEALSLAETRKNKKVVFLAIGFETTVPGTAAGVLEARDRKLYNFFILSAQKTMPPAMRAVVDGGTRVKGFICPGHVSAVTGSRIYLFLPREFGIGCVIAGFEPVDILYSVLMLVRQINRNEPQVEIQYKRAVRSEGNPRAVKIMNDVFTGSDEWWRGFGIIPRSGLQLRDEFEEFDAWKIFPAITKVQPDEGSCMCGEILRGKNTPADCSLFGTGCTPGNPLGACMVSPEGACNTYHKYGVRKHNC